MDLPFHNCLPLQGYDKIVLLRYATFTGVDFQCSLWYQFLTKLGLTRANNLSWTIQTWGRRSVI